MSELSHDPQNLQNRDDRRTSKQNWWFYEHEYGLEIHTDGGGSHTCAVVPLRAIKGYLKRLRPEVDR